MQIEVIVTGWEHGCCGAPFQVGGEATWQLTATAERHPDGVARFVHDGHEQQPHDLPHWDVTGTVTAITGIRYPSIPIPGEPHSYRADRSAPEPHVLEGVAARADGEFTEFRVLLDVPDGTDLPAYTPGSAQLAEAEDAARIAAIRQARLSDDVGVLLEALADDAQERYADVADTIRATNTSAVSIEPRQTDAAAVHWKRVEDGDDGIAVQVGDGRWHFPATATHAALVADFLDAAVHGRVKEQVRPHDTPNRLDTVVVAADGRSWTATVPFQPFTGDGFFAMPGQLWKRIQRGDHRYGPWTTGPAGNAT